MYIDFAKSYFIEFIIKNYKKFVVFFDEYLNKTNIEIYISKNEMKSFLIQNCKLLIMKNYRFLMYIRTNNVKKYIVINIVIKFNIIYNQY